mgnify:CR=1 FL=1
MTGISAHVETREKALAVQRHAAADSPVLVFLAGLPSEHSRRTMRRYLAQIANGLLAGQWKAPVRADYSSAAEYREALERYNGAPLALDWPALRFQHVAAIRARIMGMYAPATVNGMLSALRGVLKACWKLELISAEDYQRAVDVDNVKGETLAAGRDLQQGEILALVTACADDGSAAGVRDAAVIGLLYTCALRRAELAALDLADFNPETGALRVRGKGRKERTVYATNGALEALREWLALRGSQPGPLFMPVNKAGHISARRITAQAVYNMLRKRAAAAGVNDFSPHDFRRTFAGDLLDRGVDIVTVQKLMGHASPTTTARYDRRGEEAKKEAAAKLHFPYKRRLSQRGK